MAQNHVLLETIVLQQNATSVTFDNLPTSGYTDLKLIATMRDTPDNMVRYSMGFNSSSATATTRQFLYGTAASITATKMGTATSVGYGATRSGGTANTYGMVEVTIPKYRSSDYKTFSIDGAEENNSADCIMSISAGVWENTAAITSVSFVTDATYLAAGSTFSLYGIADFNTTPSVSPFADGGNIVANDGTYWYHAFLSSGTFVPKKNLTCDYLVVAGGGGGNSLIQYSNGGGGAGGLRSTVSATGGGGSLESPLSLTSSTLYPVVVGAGGAITSNGSNSTFSTITSTGGGLGGYGLGTTPGSNGGSGGGGGSNGGTNAVGGSGTSGQGYAGGTAGGTTGNNSRSGGGGGAGGVGANATPGISPNAFSGNGGAGVSIPSFAAATNTGVSNYYAGGGGGGTDNGTANNRGLGGSGGGGNGAASDAGYNAVAGTANTGGGGGGGGWSSKPGAAGGSGIVIIRYAMA